MKFLFASLFLLCIFLLLYGYFCDYRRDAVSRGGFNPLVESYQKTLKNGIHSFPARRSAFGGGCGEQAGKFACCVLGQGT